MNTPCGMMPCGQPAGRVCQFKSDLSLVCTQRVYPGVYRFLSAPRNKNCNKRSAVPCRIPKPNWKAKIFDDHVIPRYAGRKIAWKTSRTSLREVVHHTAAPAVRHRRREGLHLSGPPVPLRAGRGIWGLPAGSWNRRGSIESAKRELSEECGLSADNYTNLVSSTPHCGL